MTMAAIDWKEVVVELDTCAVEAMANAVHELGAGGVVIEHMGAISRVVAYFPAGGETEGALKRLRSLADELVADGSCVKPPIFDVTDVSEKDWAEQWKEHYHPVVVGNIRIQPSWLEGPKTGLIIYLDPGLAFGTGVHATTQLCLRELELLVRPGDTVMDLGCGSGILSIAAAKLGAAKVLAVDSDQKAVEIAEENVSLNGCGRQVEVVQDDVLELTVVPETAVAVANIGSEAATKLLEAYVDDPVADYLVLTGFARHHLETLCQLAGDFFLRSRCKGEWALLVAGKKK